MRPTALEHNFTATWAVPLSRPAPQPAAGDSAVAQPTTVAFGDLVRAPELTGDALSRHSALHRSTPRKT
jgi:hypothetical protein